MMFLFFYFHFIAPEGHRFFSVTLHCKHSLNIKDREEFSLHDRRVIFHNRNNFMDNLRLLVKRDINIAVHCVTMFIPDNNFKFFSFITCIYIREFAHIEPSVFLS